MTVIQQTPIKKNGGDVIDISLGGNYAKELGLGDITEYDGTSVVEDGARPATNADESKQEGAGKKGAKKKKKNNKKKKK